MKLTLKEYFYSHTKAIIFLVVALSFLVKMNILFSYMNYGPDNIVQAITAQSMMKGHGLSLPEADVHDLSKTVYKPYGLFPPGFALTVAPLLKITHNDLTLSVRILLIIGFALFYLVWLKIFYVLKNYIQHEIVIIGIFIFWGINYSPLNMGSVTDVFSLTLISAAILFFLKIIVPASLIRKKQLLYAVLIGLFSFLAAFYRFAYYPLAIAVPFFFSVLALFFKKEWRFPAFLSLVLAGVLFCSLIIFQNLTTGPINWTNSGNGINILHWENLKYFDAVFLNSFVYDGILYSILYENTVMYRSSYSLFFVLFSTSTIIFVLLTSLIYNYSIKSKISFINLKDIVKQPLSILILFLICVILVQILFLSYIALTSNSFSIDPKYIESYVTLPRHFLIVFLAVQIIVFVIIFNKKVKINKLLKNITLSIIILACIITFAFRFYHEKKLQLYKPEEVAADYYKLSEHIKKSTAHIVVVKTIPDEYLYRYAMLNGATIIEFDSIKKMTYASKPVFIYTHVYANDSSNEFYTFAKETGAKKIMNLENLKVDIFSKTTGI